MATPSAILSVLVQADTDTATGKLTKFDKQLAATNDVARKGIEAKLGAKLDSAAFDQYEARLARASRIARDRAAFKAELGANFNPAAFNAYERAVDKARAAGKITATVQVQTAEAIARLNALQVKMGQVPDKISTEVEVDDAVAVAKLDLINRKIRDTERGIATAGLNRGGGGGGILSGLLGLFGGGSGGGGGFGGGGGAASSAAGGGSGLLSGSLQTAAGIAALAPIAAAGVGSATAVAGSAGAGALGAGALGIGALGAGAAGIGPLVALSGGLKDATALATKLEAADHKLTAAQTLYGDSSKQAAAAQLAINKLVAGADPAVVKFAQTWGKFTDTMDKASQSVLPAFSKTLAPIVAAITQLMPTIVQMARIDLSGISKGLAPLLNLLKSADFKDSLVKLSQTFAKLVVPLGQAGASLLTAFMHVAVAAAPFLVQIADAFARWAKGFSDSLAPGKGLTDMIGGLVGQLRSWWNLAKSIGGLMITVFSAGAGQGKSLVDLLTGVVTKWNAWLNTKSGQDAMKTFFKDSKDLVVALFNALGPLVGAVIKLAVNLMPTFTGVIRALTPIVHALGGAFSAVADAIKSKLVTNILVLWMKAIVLALTPLKLGLEALSILVGNTGNIWGRIWQGMKNAFSSVLSFILGGLSTLLGAVKSVLDSANIKLPVIGHLFGDAGTKTSAALGQAQKSIDAYRTGLNPMVSDTQTATGQIGRAHKQMATQISAAATQALNVWTSAFQSIDQTTGNVFKQVKDQLKTDLKNISDNLGTGTKQGQAALVAGLSGALQTILDNTSASVRGTAHGIKAINDALDASLVALGASKSAIKALGPVVAAEAFTGYTLPTGPLHKATGGLFQVGRPGEAGHDTVPMSVGGRDIAVGSGEQIAVFNRHQLPIVNKALSREGYAGLPGLFSKVNRPHYMASGGFVPGFATGGTLNYGQLEGLWDQGGGPPSVAPIAAAIALAESRGQDVMQQGQPFATTGWGYWQITPGGPQYLDPLTNARAAVAKYRGAGNTFRPWTTFNSGAYRAFLQGGVPATGGAAVAHISAPGVKGAGVFADIARGALKLDAAAANAFLARMAPAGGFAGAVSGGLKGAYGALHLGRTDQGVDFGGAGPVGAVAAGRVLRTKIWPGWPGSGGLVYSTAQGNVYIMEDFAPSVVVGQALQAGQIVGRATGGKSGIETGWANAAGTGPLTPYNGAADGTPMPGGVAFRKFLGLSSGGVFGRKGGGPIIPAGKALLGGFGPPTLGGKTLAQWWDLPGAAAAAPGLPSAGSIIGLPPLPKLAGAVPSTPAGARGVAATIFGTRAGIVGNEQSYGEIDQFYGQQDAALAFVDPNTGALNPDAINQRLAHLTILIAYRQKIFDQWSNVVALTGRLISAYRIIVANLGRKLARAKDTLARLRAALSHLSTKGLKGKALTAMTRDIADLKHKIGDADKLITKTTGEIATVAGNLKSARGDLTTATGDRGNAWLSLLAEKGEYASVAGTVASPLSSAASALGAGAVAATDQTSALLAQLLATSQQTLAVSQAQYKTLQGGGLRAIDFGGSFAQGGVVPGPTGAPRAIIAHGGEVVSPVGAAPAVHIHFANGMDWLRQFVSVEVEQTTRGQARRGSRSLPGSR